MAAGLAPDLQEIDAQLEAACAEALAIASGLDDALANRQPPGGGWSVAQCLDHLALATRTYLAAIEAALAGARRRGLLRHGLVAPGFLARRFIASLEPPVRRRGRAPSLIVPASSLPLTEALSRFTTATAAARRVVAADADLDWSVRFVNPYVPLLRFRVAAGFRIVAAHDRRHLWQARRAREQALATS